MKRVTQKLTSLVLVAAALSFAAGTANAGPFVPKVAGTWEIIGTPDPGGCGPSAPFTNVSTITFGGQITNVDPILGSTDGTPQCIYEGTIQGTRLVAMPY